MKINGKNFVVLTCAEIVNETEKAYRIRGLNAYTMSKREVTEEWFPKSHIDINVHGIMAAEWIAKQKKLAFAWNTEAELAACE